MHDPDAGLRLADLTELSIAQPERLLPIRLPDVLDSGRSFRGLQYLTRSGDQILFESRLESRVLSCLDFDPTVERISAQPLTIYNLDGRRGVTPDFALKRTDGSRWLIDVCPRDLQSANGPLSRQTRTARLCEIAGWGYLVVGDPEPWLWRLVRLLHHFHRPSVGDDLHAENLLRACVNPAPFGQVVEAIDAPEVLVRPLLLHLCWWQQILFVEPEASPDDDSLVVTAVEGGRALPWWTDGWTAEPDGEWW